MNRRGFLRGLIAAGAAAISVDPDRLLWVPGKRLISIPKPMPPPVPRNRIGDTIKVRLPMRYVGRCGEPLNLPALPMHIPSMTAKLYSSQNDFKPLKEL